MSEVEKMYENAGVKADRIVCYRGFDNCMDNDFNCHCHNEKPCKDAAKIYPLFTAEKQLEIIKLLAKWEITIVRLLDTWYFSTDGIIGIFKLKGDFEDALANYINLVWQDLTPEEKQQVKGILE